MRRLRGPKADHPFFDETERMEVLAALEAVDCVFKFRGPCSIQLLAELKPDFYCFSPYDPKCKEKKRDAHAAGTQARTVGSSLRVGSRSTSRVGRLLHYSFLLDAWRSKLL